MKLVETPIIAAITTDMSTGASSEGSIPGVMKSFCEEINVFRESHGVPIHSTL
jgi:hypothetical protein